LKLTRRRHLQLIAAAAITPALAPMSRAQSWPAKPIRVIIPFTAGSTIDIVARIVFEPLGRQLGQALVIENRGGGGGTVGAAAVARAEPDGYTLMAHSSAHVTTPAIYPNAPYDTAEDFAAVAAFGSSPNVTVVAPERGFKTLQQLVAAAKAKPGSITYGTAGLGSATHISAEILRFSAGFEALHVPFRGMPEILTEIIAGRVDFTCSTIATALPFIREGKLVALAVSTPQRSSRCPMCRPRPRPATRIPITRSGPGCSFRPRHRARSSTSWPMRRRKRWPRRACGRNSRSKAWTRCRSRRLPSTRRSGGRLVQFSPWPKRRT